MERTASSMEKKVSRIWPLLGSNFWIVHRGGGCAAKARRRRRRRRILKEEDEGDNDDEDCDHDDDDDDDNEDDNSEAASSCLGKVFCWGPWGRAAAGLPRVTIRCSCSIVFPLLVLPPSALDRRLVVVAEIVIFLAPA